MHYVNHIHIHLCLQLEMPPLPMEGAELEVEQPHAGDQEACTQLRSMSFNQHQHVRKSVQS